MTAESALRQLLDRHEIHDVLLCYARGIDRVDRDLVRSCFHDDAELDYGIFKGVAGEVFDAKARGQDSDAGAWAQVTAHYITNVLIRVDGDVATSEAYCLAFHRTTRTSAQIGFTAEDPSSEVPGVQRDVIVAARYVDRFERRDGRTWKIARRTEVWDWSRVEPVGNHWLLDANCFTLGRRDGSDLVDVRPDLGGHRAAHEPT